MLLHSLSSKLCLNKTRAGKTGQTIAVTIKPKLHILKISWNYKAETSQFRGPNMPLKKWFILFRHNLVLRLWRSICLEAANSLLSLLAVRIIQWVSNRTFFLNFWKKIIMKLFIVDKKSKLCFNFFSKSRCQILSFDNIFKIYKNLWRIMVRY